MAVQTGAKSKTDLERARIAREVKLRQRVSGSLLVRVLLLGFNVLLGVVAWKALEHRGETRRVVAYVAALGKHYRGVGAAVAAGSHCARICASSLSSLSPFSAFFSATSIVDRRVDVDLLKTAFVASLVLGFFGTARYHHNRKAKNEKNQRLAVVPGKLGVQYVLTSTDVLPLVALHSSLFALRSSHALTLSLALRASLVRQVSAAQHPAVAEL